MLVDCADVVKHSDSECQLVPFIYFILSTYIYIVNYKTIKALLGKSKRIPLDFRREAARGWDYTQGLQYPEGSNLTSSPTPPRGRATEVGANRREQRDS